MRGDKREEKEIIELMDRLTLKVEDLPPTTHAGNQSRILLVGSPLT